MLTTNGDVAVARNLQMMGARGRIVKSPPSTTHTLSPSQQKTKDTVTAMEGRERRTSLISQTVTETEPLSNSHSNTQQQQQEAQKVEALKKAYADVILNTAKEAAERIMASERRALRFQHELESTKYEAIRMLLRLKQMLDAKTAEEEMTSLNQQSKIEELEAQLNEAEDVITDLRAELIQVWLELEKKKNSQVQSYGQVINQAASFEEGEKPEDLESPPNEDLECVINCNAKNKSPTLNVLDDKCCNSTKQTEQSCISNLEDFYAHEPDFASIIMRSKEPELCKNGCTQRVRAVEGNLLDEKLLSRDEHNQHIGIKNGFNVKDSDQQVVKFSAPSTKTNKMDMKKHVKYHKRPKRKIFSDCRSCLLSSCKIHITEKCKSNKGARSLLSIKPCAICKWKRKKRRCGRLRLGSSVSACCKPSFVLKQSSCVHDDGKCSDDVAKMKPVPPLTGVEPVHGSTSVTESVQAVNKSELVEKAIENDDDEILNLEESTSQNLTGPRSRMKVEIVDIPSTNTNLENAKSFEANDGSPGQPDNGRLLKYTFQRKRKKESLGNSDERTDSEKSTVKRRVEKKP